MPAGMTQPPTVRRDDSGKILSILVRCIYVSIIYTNVEFYRLSACRRVLLREKTDTHLALPVLLPVNWSADVSIAGIHVTYM